MSGQATPVWVLTVTAVAGPRNAEPDGRRYDILLFARGEDEDEARAAGAAALDDRGWDEAEIVRAGEITDPSAVPPDLSGPMERAARDGAALVIYDS